MVINTTYLLLTLLAAASSMYAYSLLSLEVLIPFGMVAEVGKSFFSHDESFSK